jgi:predicted nucleic acid-binding protein
MERVPEARPVAVYDANVLYPAHLRDLLMRLAAGDLVRAHWSDQIHEEWMRNVHADYADVTWEDLEYTRSEMDRALPDARVEGHEGLAEDLSLPDPGDRHVLAAAIYAQADCIVTFNLRDFPQARLGPQGIEAIHPDELVELLMDRAPECVLEVASRHRAALRKPPMNPGEYLSTSTRFEEAGSKRRRVGWKTAARSFEERQSRNTLG